MGGGKKFRKLALQDLMIFEDDESPPPMTRYPRALHPMKVILPRTCMQRVYYESLRNKALGVVVATGATGSGKTMLACAGAAEAFDRGEVSRILLTRPAVSAEGPIGYLPGTLESKMSPYTRVMTDVFVDMWGAHKTRVLQENGCMEVASLGFLRGRSLHNTWVILDEAQNTSPLLMKMALTRLGDGSKMTVTGDLEQCDISGSINGLQDLVNRIPAEHHSIRHVALGTQDVQRSGIVRDLLEIYC